MSRSFQLIRNEPSPQDLAIELARKTIAEHQAAVEVHRALVARLTEGMTPEQVESRELTQEEQDTMRRMQAAAAKRMRTLAALIAGRHRAVVLPIVLETFPMLGSMAPEPKVVM